MRILLVMDPGIMVPPKGYGGHERLVAMFAAEYRRLGHEVHLLVTEGSEVEGCTIHPLGIAGFPPKKADARRAVFRAWRFLWKHRHSFDLVHNFGRLVYLLPILHHPVRKIMTYGREISQRNIRVINTLPNRNLVFTGCSADLISRIEPKGRWEVVYNAIPFDQYTLKTDVSPDAPLMFLGRIERVKGAHTAIEVALKTGNRLILAGNVSPLPEEQVYFKTLIEPHIDGVQICYVGALNDQEKNHWLGQAKALLFPIEWNEPFGMVMVEAMACGTPVIAYRRGSVPEVVDEGITGYKVSSLQQMVFAIENLNLSRQRCREQAQMRFDTPVIAEHYLQLFHA
ncbi:MAG TPA: glycosyltransferase [Luteibaculaceae bacterium]|nr:glycosyltransferase [Luteibaculaceae bacterium]